VRVIHIVRKPLSESSVAANVLKHGTGALNNDASRIAATEADARAMERVNTPMSGQWSGGLSGGVYGKPGHNVGKPFDTRQGRWPANLILQHLDGCRPAGTTRVPGSVRKPTGNPIYPTDGGSVKWNPNDVRDSTVRGHADEDGMETVETWDCEPGCPVADLDGQTGTLKSGALQSEQYRDGVKDSVARGHMKGFVHKGYEADSGGAARFFKQVGGSQGTEKE